MRRAVPALFACHFSELRLKAQQGKFQVEQIPNRSYHLSSSGLGLVGKPCRGSRFHREHEHVASAVITHLCVSSFLLFNAALHYMQSRELFLCETQVVLVCVLFTKARWVLFLRFIFVNDLHYQQIDETKLRFTALPRTFVHAVSHANPIILATQP